MKLRMLREFYTECQCKMIARWGIKNTKFFGRQICLFPGPPSRGRARSRAEVAAVAAAVVPRDHVVAVVAAAAAVVAGPRNTPPGAAHRGRRWARRLRLNNNH